MNPAHTLGGGQWAQHLLLPHPRLGAGRARARGGFGALTALAELATEAGKAETLAAGRVAEASVLALAQPLAASPVEARGTG